MTKYPDINVRLSDGNAFFILGAVARALREAGVEADEIASFNEEATAGDYNDLLATVMRWVEVEL